MKQTAMFSDRMEICGNTDIYFDRCRRLLECTELLVLLELGGCRTDAVHRVAVWGHGLTASDYSGGGLHISGEIRAVEFDGGL